MLLYLDHWKTINTAQHMPKAKVNFTDSSTCLAELKSRVLAFARERDWEQFHSPKNLSMALAAEAAELMEHFLWATPAQSRRIAREKVKGAKIAEEPGPTCCDLCAGIRQYHRASTWRTRSRKDGRQCQKIPRGQGPRTGEQIH